MSYSTIITTILLCLIAAQTNAQSPLLVSNARTTQRAGTKIIDVSYDLTGGVAPFAVSVQGSNDGGNTWTLPVHTLSGHVGSGVTPGRNRSITWDAGADWGGQLGNMVRFKILVTDSGLAAPILASPANNSTKFYSAPANPRHTFSWQVVNGADSYRLVVKNRLGTVVVDEITSALTHTPNLDLYTVTWQVYALKDSISGPSSAVWTARVIVLQ